jgi:acyl CoA:acetate/3-ketoacid CoA transferase alpha subunit
MFMRHEKGIRLGRSRRSTACCDGMLIAAGGFGLCGIPELLIDAIREAA